MINAIIRNGEKTLAVTFPIPMLELNKELLSIGIRDTQLPLNVDETESEISINLLADSDIGNHLIRIFGNNDTLSTVNTACDLISRLDEEQQSEIENDIIYDQYSNSSVLFNDLKGRLSRQTQNNENSPELQKMKNAVKLIEDMTGHRFKPCIGDSFIYDPLGDNYLAINMNKKSDYSAKLYRISFDVNLRTMGRPMNADGLLELQKEVGIAHALLTALEMQEISLNPVGMQEFNDYIREQDRLYEEQEESDDPVMEQTM